METDDYEELLERRRSDSLAENSGQYSVCEDIPPDVVYEGLATPNGPALPSTGLHINTIASSPFQAASVKAVEERKGHPVATSQR
jgi:hypothetical protein